MALIVEVLDTRAGGVRTRVRVHSLPVRIGRALDNDLILDDPYVDAQHAHIMLDEATGELVLEDSGSINGVIAARSGERITRVQAKPGTELRLGRTTLRFRDSSEPVEPALRETTPHVTRVPRWAATTRGQLAVCAAAIITFGASIWLGSYDRSAATDTFTAVLGIIAISGMWAGSWAVASRIIVHRFHFLAHLALFSLMILLFWLWGTVNEWAVFVFPDNPVSTPVATLFSFGFVAALIATHLGLATALPARRRWQTGALAGVLILALTGVGALTSDDSFSDVPEFAGTVKAISAKWLPTQSLAEFSETAASLKEEVDELP